MVYTVVIRSGKGPDPEPKEGAMGDIIVEKNPEGFFSVTEVAFGRPPRVILAGLTASQAQAFFEAWTQAKAVLAQARP